ncbi:unnamed protein product [Ilex paraguariensis]|uniref:Uncharacterized protein n=1 Tax=Ilex paraguariensis TaxID=185542 RepID=A0ABC8SH53_9AQUA
MLLLHPIQSPNAQQMLEIMQQLKAQNQQILQLMLGQQGRVQPRPQAKETLLPGHQGAPHLGAPHPVAPWVPSLGVPLGTPYRGAHHKGPPPASTPTLYGGDPPLQEDESKNQSIEYESHFHGNSRVPPPNQWDEKNKRGAKSAT